jgi:hypothetical protein
VTFGVTLAGLSARLASWLPLPSTNRRVLVRDAVPAAFAAFAYAVTAVFLVVCGAVVVATRWHRLVNAVRSPRAVLIGRVITISIVVAALPNAVISVADIAGR